MKRLQSETKITADDKGKWEIHDLASEDALPFAIPAPPIKGELPTKRQKTDEKIG